MQTRTPRESGLDDINSLHLSKMSSCRSILNLEFCVLKRFVPWQGNKKMAITSSYKIYLDWFGTNNNFECCTNVQFEFNLSNILNLVMGDPVKSSEK